MKFTACLKKEVIGNIEIWKDCIENKFFAYDTKIKKVSKYYETAEEIKENLKKK